MILWLQLIFDNVNLGMNLNKDTKLGRIHYESIVIYRRRRGRRQLLSIIGGSSGAQEVVGSIGGFIGGFPRWTAMAGSRWRGPTDYMVVELVEREMGGAGVAAALLF